MPVNIRHSSHQHRAPAKEFDRVYCTRNIFKNQSEENKAVSSFYQYKSIAIGTELKFSNILNDIGCLPEVQVSDYFVFLALPFLLQK